MNQNQIIKTPVQDQICAGTPSCYAKAADAVWTTYLLLTVKLTGQVTMVMHNGGVVTHTTQMECVPLEAKTAWGNLLNNQSHCQFFSFILLFYLYGNPPTL